MTCQIQDDVGWSVQYNSSVMDFMLDDGKKPFKLVSKKLKLKIDAFLVAVLKILNGTVSDPRTKNLISAYHLKFHFVSTIDNIKG